MYLGRIDYGAVWIASVFYQKLNEFDIMVLKRSCNRDIDRSALRTGNYGSSVPASS